MYVYLIWCKINGKRYVGQTVQPLKKRFNEHATKRNKSLLGKAMRKYGRENFYCGIIKVCTSKEELDYWEKYYIAALKTKIPYGYNLCDGGEGVAGYSKTPEHCANLSTALKNRKFTPEWRTKISEALKGREITPEWRANLSAAHKGKPHSVLHNLHVGMASRGYSPFKNLLYEIETRRLTYKELARFLNLDNSTVSRKMHGKVRFTERDRAKIEEFFNKSADYLLNIPSDMH